GDHISHHVKGGTNVNFQPQILIQCSSGEYEELYATPEAAWPCAAGQRRHCTGGANRGAGQSQLAQAPLKKAEQVAEPRGASCNTVSSIRPWMLCSGGQADIHRVALAAEPVRRQKPPCRRREGHW